MPEAERRPEKLQAVISRQYLTPTLRSARVTLRYSPDGRHLLLQDPSGIYVLSSEPLKLLGYVDAASSYPARFSADSQSIIVVSWALSYQKYAIRDGQRLDSRELQVRDGWTPHGRRAASYRGKV